MSFSEDSRSYNPLHWFIDRKSSDDKENNDREALIIVNNNLLGLDGLIKKYWSRFSVICCADGGSNILFDCCQQEPEKYIPNIICGDLDSIRPQVLRFYKQNGTKIVERPDQDSTDLAKTLNFLHEERRKGEFQGGHRICTDSGLEEGHCGLVPLGECCSDCSTTGLRWNLGADHKMEFGGLISTNNIIDSRCVAVSTSTTLLWTMSHKLLSYSFA